jgi:hypothetical protein
MVLVQTFKESINGFWDGGEKKRFIWSIQGPVRTDGKGQYVKVGSFEANHWFHVSVGKTDKATLGNARKVLARGAAKSNKVVEFEYTNEEY